MAYIILIADVLERPVAEVRKKLIDLGLVNRGEQEIGADDDGSVEGGMSTPSARSSSSSEPEEDARDMREVILGKKTNDPLANELSKLFDAVGGIAFTDAERLLLGASVCEKYRI